MTRARLESTLAELRRRLRVSDDFASIATYFLTEIADCDRLHERSKPCHKARLEAAIASGLATLPAGLGEQPPDLVLLRYRKTDFFHGVVQAGRQVGGFFYFRHADQGLLVMPGGYGSVHYLRLTMTEAAPRLAS